MVNKKVVYVGIIFFSVVLVLSLAVSLVSAKHAWWHAWGEEPGLAPFNATVTIQGVAPTIPWVFNVSDDYGSSFVNFVSLTGLGPLFNLSNVYVTFLAHDDNGFNDLPASPTVGVGSDININITYGGLRADSTSYIASAASADTCVVLNNSATERLYFCNLSNSMQFWYQPNRNLSSANPNLWTIGITIRDVSSSQIARNNTFNFSYIETSVIDNIVNLTWIGISPSGTDQKASDNVSLINYGNSYIGKVNITAYNMTGATYTLSSNKYIPARTIRSYGTLGSECSDPPASTFAENSGINVTGIGLDFGGPSIQSTFIRFCIFPALTSLSEGLNLLDSPYAAARKGGTYATTGTADWRLCYGGAC